MRWILVCFACAGCGSTIVSSDGGADAGTDGTVGDASSDAAGKPGCPATRPANDTACPAVGLLCEYDDTYIPTCLKRCGADLKWSDAAGQCPAITPDAGGACPAQFPAKAFVACAAPGECDYSEGSCICARTCGGPPDPNPPPSHWICNTNPTGCPVPRPRFGDACNSENAACDYTICCSGASMLCHDKMWQGSFSSAGCP